MALFITLPAGLHDFQQLEINTTKPVLTICLNHHVDLRLIGSVTSQFRWYNWSCECQWSWPVGGFCKSCKSVPKMVMTISSVMTAIEEVITGGPLHATDSTSACESLRVSACSAKQWKKIRWYNHLLTWVLLTIVRFWGSAQLSAIHSQVQSNLQCNNISIQCNVGNEMTLQCSELKFGERFLGQSWIKCRTEFRHQQSWTLLIIVIIIMIIAKA